MRSGAAPSLGSSSGDLSAGGCCPARRCRMARPAGFSLIELLVVMLLLALAVGLATMALRDGKATHLEDEAARLSALLEGARAHARATGQTILWLPQKRESSPGMRSSTVGTANQGIGGQAADSRPGFAFIGLPPGVSLPTHWLDGNIRAEVLGPRPWLTLGPEPIIGPQRLRLILEDRQLLLGTDGLRPFARLEPSDVAAGETERR